jgi:hypothetical protein
MEYFIPWKQIAVDNAGVLQKCDNDTAGDTGVISCIAISNGCILASTLYDTIARLWNSDNN